MAADVEGAKRLGKMAAEMEGAKRLGKRNVMSSTTRNIKNVSLLTNFGCLQKGNRT